MLRIFLINIVRSILFCALAFVVSGALDIGIAYLVKLIFHVPLPFWACVVAACLFSIAVFSLLMKWGEDTPAILPDLYEERGSRWLERAARGKHVKFIVVWFSLLIHLAVGGVAVWLYVQFGEGLAGLFVDPPAPYLHKGMYLAAALASVAVVQTGYFFCYWFHYKKMRCPRCKNVHCFVYAGEKDVKEDVTYEFEPDENSSERVSFELDGVRYEATGHKWNKREKVSRQISYARRCVICGKKSYDYRYQFETGGWEKEKKDQD